MISQKLSAVQEARMRAELTGGKSPKVYRRAAALLAVHQGWPVTSIAQLLGVARQSVYNWIAVYGTADHEIDLTDAPRSGRPALWTEDLDNVLMDAVDRSPSSFGFSVDQWTAGILRDYLAACRQKNFSAETIRRRLRQLGYLWKAGRYIRIDAQAAAGSVSCSIISIDAGLSTTPSLSQISGM